MNTVMTIQPSPPLPQSHCALFAHIRDHDVSFPIAPQTISSLHYGSRSTRLHHKNRHLLCRPSSATVTLPESTSSTPNYQCRWATTTLDSLSCSQKEYNATPKGSATLGLEFSPFVHDTVEESEQYLRLHATIALCFGNHQ